MNEHAIIQAKHTFSESETKELGSVLAQKNIAKAELQDAKKLANSRFKEQIDTIQNAISTLSHNLANGYEFRDYKCTVEFDYKKKKKTYLEVGTGRKIEVRDFAPEDYQRPLPFSETQSEPKKERPRKDLD